MGNPQPIPYGVSYGAGSTTNALTSVYTQVSGNREQLIKTLQLGQRMGLNEKDKVVQSLNIPNLRVERLNKPM